MKAKSKTGKGILKIIAALSIGIIAVRGFADCETAMICEAKADQSAEEVEKFIRRYYKIYSEKNLDALKDYIKEEDYLEEQTVRMNVLYEYGFVGYNLTDVLVYPLSDGIHWVAYINSELLTEDLEVALPGARMILVEKSDDGNFCIVVEGDLDQDIIDEIREISLSDEIVDRTIEQGDKYNDIVAEESDVRDWITEVSDAQTKAFSEKYTLEKAYEEESGSRRGDIYLVKKGDCLWSIAEENLGDGMCWNEIYETNKAVIGDDPDLLYVGIELEISKGR